MTTGTLDAFQVLADPSRRQILHLLSEDRLTINSIAENFDISRPAVSKHIKALSTAGFIAIEEVGRERYCVLKQDGFNELQEWLSYFDAFWQSRLHQLQQVLNARPAPEK